MNKVYIAHLCVYDGWRGVGPRARCLGTGVGRTHAPEWEVTKVLSQGPTCGPDSRGSGWGRGAAWLKPTDWKRRSAALKRRENYGVSGAIASAGAGGALVGALSGAASAAVFGFGMSFGRK